MDKKLGIILKNKGLFRNLALLECFLGILGRPKKIKVFLGILGPLESLRFTLQLICLKPLIPQIKFSGTRKFNLRYQLFGMTSNLRYRVLTVCIYRISPAIRRGFPLSRMTINN